MKILLSTLLFFMTVFRLNAQHKEAQAPSIRSVIYKVDTFRYQGGYVLKQRYPPLKVYPVYEDTSANNKLCIAINKLQDELDNMNSFIVLKSHINFTEVGADLLNQIRNSGSDFDYTNYEKEFDFYVRVNKALADSRAEKARVEHMQKEQEHERYVMEATAKEKERTRIKDSTDAARREEELLADAYNKIAEAKERKALEKELAKKYGSANAKAIVNGQVLLGMTREMCLIAWGEPYTTNKSTAKGIVVEKWIYDVTQFLVFKNGKVTMINE